MLASAEAGREWECMGWVGSLSQWSFSLDVKVSWGRVEGEKGSQTYVTFVYACASGVSKAR